ncbi:MAG TPA: Co2+/Mg2+ efflux protein ApaG [Caulobacterales bacterium]|jgi:ApaG protein|nr:Co2+/Mg2+ efflux protein ApaG [Caulobacterales bacterium]
MSTPLYERETNGVRVRAAPSFLDHESNPAENRYVWAYTIEIVNERARAVRLMHRYWRITDAAGLTQEVRGPGVVGKQPLIEPGEAFSYTSACPLAAPAGMMQGVYDMIDSADGAHLEIEIPAFALDSPFASRLAN